MTLIDLLLMIYPRAWRDRYEDEFRAMLECYPALGIADYADIALTACETRIVYTKGILMKDMLNRLSGLVAAASVLMVMALFYIPSEDGAETMLVLAPIVGAFTIPALHRVMVIHAPRAAWGVSGIGAVALGSLVVSIVLNIVGIGQTAMSGYAFNGLIVLSFASLVLIGIWMMAVSLLGLYTGTFNRWFALIGVIAGVSFAAAMVFTGVRMVAPTFASYGTGLFSLVNWSAFGFLIVFPLWMIGLAALLFTGSLSRKLPLTTA